MKKLIGILAVVLIAFSVNALADSYSYEMVSGGTQVLTTAALPVSGYLDKIEVTPLTGSGTNNIVIATYAGTKAVEVIGLITPLTTVSKVIRLRSLPTDNTGTALAAVEGVGYGTNGATTMLVVNYDKILAGGNLKIVSTNTGTIAVTNVFTFYYEPLKK